MRASIDIAGQIVLLLLLTGCPTALVVPALDPKTPPAVTLDINFPQKGLFTVSPTGFNPVMPTKLQGTEPLDLAALCTDKTSGCKSIEIRVEGTATAADGTVSTVPASATLALTQDPNNSGPGSKAADQLRALNTLQVGPLRHGMVALKLTVFARAINSFNTVTETRKVTLFWTNAAMPVGSACVRFSPIGSPGPTVLDGRLIFEAIENAKNNTPGKTTFIIGVRERPTPGVVPTWRVTLTEMAGMPRTMANFTLVDETGRPKSAQAVDSRACNRAGALLQAGANGTSTTATVTNADTTTIVLTDGNQDVVIWDEASFWTAFGGRSTTFTWLQ